MISKRRLFIIKNKFMLIFLSLYIIGMIFSVSFGGDNAHITENIISGMKSLNQTKGLSSVLRLSMSYFSVSLIMWAFLVIMSPYRITSRLGVSVSFFIGYSAGYSSAIVLRAFPTHALKYIMLFIAPSAVVRFFLWYILYKYCISEKIDKRKEKYRCGYLLNMLIVILMSDVLIGSASVIMSDILF